MSTPLPYETGKETDGLVFLAFETGTGTHYRPWHALKSFRLAQDGRVLCFEFADHLVEVTGENMGVIATLAAAMRVKLIRVGRANETCVQSIRLLPDTGPTE